jgi:hypothetical protein
MLKMKKLFSGNAANFDYFPRLYSQFRKFAPFHCVRMFSIIASFTKFFSSAEKRRRLLKELERKASR